MVHFRNYDTRSYGNVLSWTTENEVILILAPEAIARFLSGPHIRLWTPFCHSKCYFITNDLIYLFQMDIALSGKWNLNLDRMRKQEIDQKYPLVGFWNRKTCFLCSFRCSIKFGISLIHSTSRIALTTRSKFCINWTAVNNMLFVNDSKILETRNFCW